MVTEITPAVKFAFVDKLELMAHGPGSASVPRRTSRSNDKVIVWFIPGGRGRCGDGVKHISYFLYEFNRLLIAAGMKPGGCACKHYRSWKYGESNPMGSWFQLYLQSATVQIASDPW